MYSVSELPLPIRWIKKPWRMAVLILAITFVIEGSLMIVLPSVAGEKLGKWGMAAVDAFLLTALLAPCIWGLMVRPFLKLQRMRLEVHSFYMTYIFAVHE